MKEQHQRLKLKVKELNFTAHITFAKGLYFDMFTFKIGKKYRFSFNL